MLKNTYTENTAKVNLVFDSHRIEMYVKKKK